ncbi:uroporphyrinogen-III synthase [Halieaceae bacterium IMCC14734]|uniref:Uroporphyrinogen-III synthase n=2 Tax=Candidatus Litorirhabdus singularis TaxID=2518993 RepID=A0ABT3TB47_9GAMM|nr:uroporphyrinogen-III synthase [Candidatus Litorirhabdus singularis]
MPLLVIEALQTLSYEAQQALEQLASFSHLIFVSANAVRVGMDRINQRWSELPAELSCYCVGAASAGLLQSYGVTAAYPLEAMTSEGLLALPGLANSHGERVLIVKGEGGREHLQQQLQARGAAVTTLPVYRRLPFWYTDVELQQLLGEPRPLAMLVNSGESLHNMVSLLNRGAAQGGLDSLLVVPGQRVAGLAGELGFTNIEVAGNATDGAMLEALAQRLAGEVKSGRNR